MEFIVCLSVFLPIAWQDGREKKISQKLVISIWIISIGFQIYLINGKGQSLQHFLIKLLIATVITMGASFLAIITNEKFGLGDAICVGIPVLYVSIPTYISIVFLSLVVASLWGIVKIVLKKATKKASIPYLPFLFIGIAISGVMANL